MNIKIIAEAGVNHNGDELLALKLADIAKSAGADAVKFQTFNVSELVTKRAKKARYQGIKDASSVGQLDLLKELALSEESLEKFIRIAKKDWYRISIYGFRFKELIFFG